MPPAKRADANPASGAKTTSGRAQTKRAGNGASTGAARAARSGTGQARRASAGTRARPSTAKASATESTTAKATAAADAVQEATAARLRKLNERIIEAGKHTGQVTLTSYETMLKAVARAVERGPGSSDIDWISHLATSQAKFIREFTEAWTSAARGMLK